MSDHRTHGDTTDLESDIARIAEQERRLRFENFNEDTAWDLGVQLRALATARALHALGIRNGTKTLFPVLLQLCGLRAEAG